MTAAHRIGSDSHGTDPRNSNKRLGDQEGKEAKYFTNLVFSL